MPISSTLAWLRAGTANALNTRANTKRLSTERVFSTRYPVVNSSAGPGPAKTSTPTPNTPASPRYTADQAVASPTPTVCGRRACQTSTATRAAMPATVSTQTPGGTIMASPPCAGAGDGVAG